jgi:Leucine-rich repeat (LRR) protein
MSLKKKIFSGLKNLRTINLDYNKLSYLKPTIFEGLNNLRWVSLNNNRIKAVDLTMFISLENLLRIHLESNKLSSFDKYKLFDFPAIEQVCLFNNLNLPIKELTCPPKKKNCIIKITEPC